MLLRRVRNKEDGIGLAVCECGHLQSAHSSLLVPVTEERMAREHNHGGCVDCACGRFTFEKFVSLEEAFIIGSKNMVHSS